MVNQSQFIELVKSSNPEKKTLASICTRGPQNGFYRKGAEIDGTIPIVKMSQLFGFESMGDVCHFDLVSMTEDELKRFSLTENDLLFGRRSLVPEGAGKCRRAGKVEQTVVFESSILRVSIDPDICYPRFIQAWTESPEGEQAISELRAGTSVVGITGTGLSKVIVPVPTKDIQYMFIRVAEQADKSKFAGFKSQFIEMMGDTSHVKLLCDVVGSIQTGKLDANAEEENGVYPFFTCDSVPKRINTYAFDTEAILVSGNGSQIGHINYYSGKFNAYQRTYVLSKFDSKIECKYLVVYFRLFLKPYIMENAKGSAIPYITLPILKAFKVYIPGNDKQVEICQIIEQADKSKYLN